MSTLSCRTILILLLFSTAAHAETIDLADFVPNGAGSQFTSVLSSSSGQHGVRWSSHVGTYGTDMWFRWQFSATPNEYFDVMFWSGYDNRLHYAETVTPTRTVDFLDTIAYAPRLWVRGTRRSGHGTSRVVVEGDVSCTGSVDYTWSIKPQRQSANPLTTAIAEFGTHQALTFDSGPCESFSYSDRAVIGYTPGGKGIIHMSGGVEPFSDDLQHWAMVFGSNWGAP